MTIQQRIEEVRENAEAYYKNYPCEIDCVLNEAIKVISELEERIAKLEEKTREGGHAEPAIIKACYHQCHESNIKFDSCNICKINH